MRLVVGVIIGAGLLCACGGAGGQENRQTQQTASANWATPTAPTSNEGTGGQAAVPQGPAPPVTREWLTGRWQVGGGQCASEETQFSFAADGRYSLGSEQGRWSLTGTALTIEITQAPDGHVTAGERHTSQIAAIDADTAELRKDDIPPVQLHRCR